MTALSALLYTLALHLGGRAFGPPLCRGCAPATPPSKTIAHRPCVLIPAVPLQQRGCRQPNTQSDCLNGGSDKRLVKAGTVFGLVVTPMQLPSVRAYQVELSRGGARSSFGALWSAPTSGPATLVRSARIAEARIAEARITEDCGRKLFELPGSAFPHGREMALAEELLILNQC